MWPDLEGNELSDTTRRGKSTDIEGQLGVRPNENTASTSLNSAWMDNGST
jgi:hypothetical protein